MIIQTTKEINGIVFTYTYSDAGNIIERARLAVQEAEDTYNQFIQRLAANQVAKL